MFVDSLQRRLLLFASLYFAQGATLSYFLTFNILYLRSNGFAADEIGFFQAALVLPFVLKIVLGMLSDRFSLFGLGHRFPYMLLGLLAQVGCFASLPAIDPVDHLAVFFVVALIAAGGMALYDTSTDGLAVESTRDAERGPVQGVMVGARAAGILVTLLLGSRLVDHGSWSMVFYLVALSTLPALLLVVFSWDRRRSSPAVEVFAWSAFGALARRDVIVLAATGVIYALALDGVLSYLSYHPGAGGIGSIGLVGGLVAISMFGRIAGALVNGAVTRRLGYRRAMYLAIGLSAVACGSLALDVGTVFLALACFLFGFAYGYYTAVYAAAAMALSDPRIAASMFAIFMMFLNIGVAVGQAVGGVIVDGLGFASLALWMAVVSLANLLLLRHLRVDATD